MPSNGAIPEGKSLALSSGTSSGRAAGDAVPSVTFKEAPRTEGVVAWMRVSEFTVGWRRQGVTS